MRRPYHKLTLDERRILATMLQAKATKTKIAEVLGRDRSTIHREIKRNWWHDTEVPQADGYWHVTAQTLADRRYMKRRKLEQHEDLRKEVIAKLKTGWSPEQPAVVSHEMIYAYFYSPDNQSQSLARFLPDRSKKWYHAHISQLLTLSCFISSTLFGRLTRGTHSRLGG